MIRLDIFPNTEKSKGIAVPYDAFDMHPNYNFSREDKLKVCEELYDHNIPICRYTLDLAYKNLYRNRTNTKKYNKFYKRYNTSFKKFLKNPDDFLKGEVSEKFNDRFGRVPQIIDVIAAVYQVALKNEIPENEKIVSSFNIDFVRKVRQTNLPVIDAVLFYTMLSNAETQKILSKLDEIPAGNLNDWSNIEGNTANEIGLDILSTLSYVGDALVRCVEESDIEKRSKYLNAAKWVINHLSTDSNTLRYICKNALDLDISAEDSIDAINAKISADKSLDEIKKIENKYGPYGFSLADCRCTLKNVGERVEDGRYTAYIMYPDDPRQVSLGHDTVCCQKLGDAGESAMMYGLVRDQAGFFVIEETDTRVIKVQGEAWEFDENTLIFDNLEYANDADSALYVDVLRKWLERSDYQNVYTGIAYNSCNSLNFNPDRRNGFVPPVDAHTLYIVSGEEKEIEPFASESEASSYIDTHGSEAASDEYVYSDAADSVFRFKENGKISEAFITAEEVFKLAEKCAKLNLDNLPRFYQELYNKISDDKINGFEVDNGYDEVSPETLAKLFKIILKATDGFSSEFDVLSLAEANKDISRLQVTPSLKVTLPYVREAILSYGYNPNTKKCYRSTFDSRDIDRARPIYDLADYGLKEKSSEEPEIEI